MKDQFGDIDRSLVGAPPPPEVDKVLSQQERARAESEGQMGTAAVESVLRGTTLGLSDPLLRLGGVPAEDLKRRKEAMGDVGEAVDIAGQTLPIIATGGLAAAGEAAAAKATGSKLAGAAARGAAEGAAFSAGQVASDAALGDPDLNAQKIAAHLGAGALLGGFGGAALHGVIGGVAKKNGTIKGTIADEVENAARGPDVGAAKAPDIAPGSPVVDPLDMRPGAKKGVTATNLKELEDRTKNAVYRGETAELPEMSAVSDAASRVESDYPVHPLQVESLGDQATRDNYNFTKETDTPAGKILRDNEALQKQEWDKRSAMTLDEVAGGAPVTDDAKKAGEKAIDAFSENYQKQKETLLPALKAAREMTLKNPDAILPDLIDSFVKGVPGAARMFDTEEGLLKFHPYSTSWGIDKATYTAIKQAVKDVMEGPTSVAELMNIRNGLDQHVNIMQKGGAAGQVSALRREMLDLIQRQIEEAEPLFAEMRAQAPNAEASEAMHVRQVLKEYAINEQQREVIEKAFGASVGSPEFGQISKVQPEKILDKVFNNTATVAAAKNILEPEQFNEMLANWISQKRASFTKDGRFSSKNFGNWLQKNQVVLRDAFESNPHLLQKLEDYTTLMRILPDATSINPSGSGKTMWRYLKDAHSVTGLIGSLKEHAEETLKQREMVRKIEQSLAGVKQAEQTQQGAKRLIQKTEEKIRSGLESLSSLKVPKIPMSGIVNKAILGATYDDRVKRINELFNDSDAFAAHLGNQTENIAQHLPDTSTSLSKVASNTIAFLHSKIPQPPPNVTLGPTWEPSPAEKQKFDRYYAAVSDPTIALKQIAAGHLPNETMESLIAVHPELLVQMRKQAKEMVGEYRAKRMALPIKEALSKFYMAPLTVSTTPASMAMTAKAFQGPQMPKGGGMNKPVRSSQSGLGKLKVSGRTASNVDELEAGKNGV